MGIGRFLDPRNTMALVDIAKISSSLERHMKKRCAYCGLELGNDVPVVELINHMVEKHMDKIDADDINKYQKLIKRMTK